MGGRIMSITINRINKMGTSVVLLSLIVVGSFLVLIISSIIDK
jgi:hypothetical protein